MTTSNFDNTNIPQIINMLRCATSTRSNQEFDKRFLQFSHLSAEEFSYYTCKEYIKSRVSNITTGESILPLIEIEQYLISECGKIEIKYSFIESPFGHLLIASTHKGICYIAFADNPDDAIAKLKSRFQGAEYKLSHDEFQDSFNSLFYKNHDFSHPINIHLIGSAFQLKVWTTLLNIPFGRLSTYGNIANAIEKPKASQAVGSAIGSNPIVMLIPCHRIIPANGTIGNYHYGPSRKALLIAFENFITLNPSLKYHK